VARRLHEAGNITDLNLLRERALVEEAKLQLAAAEIASRQSRAQLNTLMGLWGSDTAWTVSRRLADIPEQPVPMEGVETQAISQSLDLASARQRIIVAGEQLGFHKATALVPELSLGALAEREEGAWKVGPTFGFSLPVFDQGQGRIGRAIAELRGTQQVYYALAVQIRSTVRTARDRVQGAQVRALYYRDIVLPLRERLVNETQLQYNAMQVGVFALLRSREQQIQAAVAYIETLLDYWLTRTELGLLLSGRLPSPGSFAVARRDRSTTRLENATH
jgi:cobalt-zinc-cadmium efflux system outer membrane protein